MDQTLKLFLLCILSYILYFIVRDRDCEQDLKRGSALVNNLMYGKSSN
jgi:hypothetical protein